jgi:ribosomal protein L11 methyltransferase
MAWAEVSLSIPRERVEAVEATLLRHGALAVTLLDDADQAVFEPAPGTAPLWPVVQLRGLFTDAVDRVAVSLALIGCAELQRPEAMAWREVADQDWERAWMDRFAPMRFGRHLWIVPTGMALPQEPRALVLRLDPGLAFGTGTHPTTALCLQWIDGQEFAGLQVLDYGCGSGVLGIACAIKGAARVVCVDNDPQALQATAANAARNGVAQRVVCQTPEDYRQAAVDVVLANILAGPLIGLAGVLQGALRPGGHIVLSGILAEQADAVAQAYRRRCGTMDVLQQDGWVRLHGIADGTEAGADDEG